jgi:DNA-binding transcriptional ArsR family regulator
LTTPESPVYFVFNRMVEHKGGRAVASDALSRVFAALADPTRRDIVARLAVVEDATVNELAEPYDVSVQAVSKHLKVLEDAGLVSRSRDAQRRPVHLEAEVFDLMTKWIERYRRQAEERYRRLDELLRTMPDAVEPTPPLRPAHPPKSGAQS